MSNQSKRFAAIAISALALSVSLSITGSTVTNLASDMNLNATGGDGTAVDKDGTQGDYTAAVQGSQRKGSQEAFDTASVEAVPQFKASTK